VKTLETSSLFPGVYDDMKIYNSAPLPLGAMSERETFGLDEEVDIRSIVIGNI